MSTTGAATPRWVAGTIAHGRHPHTYYVVGTHEGPTVLLLHELPGFSLALEALANRLAERFRVVVPVIGGPDTRPEPGSTQGARQVRSVIDICIRREVHLLSRHQPGTAITWLTALVDSVVAPDGRPFGVVGMCLTGGFALSLAVDPRIRAAVAAQPSVPLSLGCGRRAADLAISPQEWAALAARTRTDADGEHSLEVRALRYRDDRLSPAARMTTLITRLGPGLRTRMLDPKTHRRPHSTLTTDTADDGALAEILDFLTDRLGP